MLFSNRQVRTFASGHFQTLRIPEKTPFERHVSGALVFPGFNGQFVFVPGLTPVHMTLPGYDSSIGGSGMTNQRYSPEFKDEAVRR